MVRVFVGCSLLACAVLTPACASRTGAVPQPFPRASDAPAPRDAKGAGRNPDTAISPELATDEHYAIVATALDLRGAPYRNGGADPFGFDCSGFTQYVFAQHQLLLPREVREQFKTGESVKLKDVAPGDLLFFSTTERGASHVAIAMGGNEFVHAPSSNGVVRVERLSSSYWSERYLGARRITRP